MVQTQVQIKSFIAHIRTYFFPNDYDYCYSVVFIMKTVLKKVSS